MIYALIFLAKATEVSIATMRSVLVNKGMRVIAVILAGIEITLWLAVTAKVITGVQTDIWQGVAYGVAYVVGIFVGMLFEDKLALGISRIEIMADKGLAKDITKALREKGFGVTSLDSMGLAGEKLVLVVDVKRRDVDATIEFIKQYEGVYVTVCDIRSVKIGKIGVRKI